MTVIVTGTCLSWLVFVFSKKITSVVFEERHRDGTYKKMTFCKEERGLTSEQEKKMFLDSRKHLLGNIGKVLDFLKTFLD